MNPHQGAGDKLSDDQVDLSRNSRSDRYLDHSVEEVSPIIQTKHPASVMMVEVATSGGKSVLPSGLANG